MAQASPTLHVTGDIYGYASYHYDYATTSYTYFFSGSTGSISGTLSWDPALMGADYSTPPNYSNHYDVALVTDCAGTYARFFEGERRIDARTGPSIELEVLSMTEDRDAALVAAEMLQARLDSQRKRQERLAISPAPLSGF